MLSKAIEPWLDGSRQVFNTYGLTEATVIATKSVRKGKTWYW